MNECFKSDTCIIKAFPHNHTIKANYLKYFHDVENKIKDNKFANHQ